MSLGGKSQPQTETKTVTEPFAEQKPFLVDVFNKAKGLYDSEGPQFFPGSTVAGFTPAQLQGRGAAADFAQNIAPQLLQNLNTGQQTAINAGRSALNMGNQLVSQASPGLQQAQNFALTRAMFPSTNPAIRDAAQGAVRPIFQALQEDVLPNIRQNAISTGNLDSTRRGIAEGKAVSDATQQALDTTAQMFSRAFETGQDTFSRALAGGQQQQTALLGQGSDQLTRGIALAPSTLSSNLLPSDVLSAIGGQKQALNQAEIDEEIARHQFEQNLPAAKLAQLANFVSGNFGGTSSTIARGPEPNRFGQALGGASVGAGLMSTLGMGNPLLGAGLGAALTLLG